MKLSLRHAIWPLWIISLLSGCASAQPDLTGTPVATLPEGFDIVTWEMLTIPEEIRHIREVVGITPDGQVLFIAEGGEEAEHKQYLLWGIPLDGEPWMHPLPHQDIMGWTFHTENARIASFWSGETLEIYDLSSRREIFGLSLGHDFIREVLSELLDYDTTQLADGDYVSYAHGVVSPDTRWCAVFAGLTHDYLPGVTWLALYNRETEEYIVLDSWRGAGTTAYGAVMQFSADSSLLVVQAQAYPLTGGVRCPQSTTLVWDVATQTKVVSGWAGRLDTIALSPDKSLIASGEDDDDDDAFGCGGFPDPHLILQDPRNRSNQDVLAEIETYALAFSLDGTSLAALHPGCIVQLWDARTKKVVGRWHLSAPDDSPTWRLSHPCRDIHMRYLPEGIYLVRYRSGAPLYSALIGSHSLEQSAADKRLRGWLSHLGPPPGLPGSIAEGGPPNLRMQLVTRLRSGQALYQASH